MKHSLVFVIIFVMSTATVVGNWKEDKQEIWRNFNLLLPLISNLQFNEALKPHVSDHATYNEQFMNSFNEIVTQFSTLFPAPVYAHDKTFLIKFFNTFFTQLNLYFIVLEMNKELIDPQVLTHFIKRRSAVLSNLYYSPHECTRELFLTFYAPYQNYFLALKNIHDKISKKKKCTIM